MLPGERENMRRVIAVCCALLILMTSAAASAEIFEPRTAKEGKMQALECLMECGFSSEYGEGGFLTRWEEEIFIYAGGDATEEDMEKLDSFLMELSFRVPFMPPVERVEDPENANIRVMFVPLDEMADHAPDYVEGNWGFGTHYWMNFVRYEGEVVICTDATSQIQRNHLIMEELIAVLGMTNDHYSYEDSIIYQGWTEVQELSEIDWLMLNMMYHPSLEPGMTAEEAREVLIDTF